MRRKPGALVPPERDILDAALGLRGVEFHGYALAARVREGSEAHSLTVNGTVYRALRRLEDMGLVASRWEDVGEPVYRPRRRLYCLTDAGRACVED